MTLTPLHGKLEIYKLKLGWGHREGTKPTKAKKCKQLNKDLFALLSLVCVILVPKFQLRDLDS